MMEPGERKKSIAYKRSRFATQLPADYLYSPSHAWLSLEENGFWRMGITKFATRMLGEMVDLGWEVDPGASISPGQVIGWLEGFKAISDVFCVMEGNFRGDNTVLKEKVTLIKQD